MDEKSNEQVGNPAVVNPETSTTTENVTTASTPVTASVDPGTPTDSTTPEEEGKKKRMMIALLAILLLLLGLLGYIGYGMYQESRKESNDSNDLSQGEDIDQGVEEDDEDTNVQDEDSAVVPPVDETPAEPILTSYEEDFTVYDGGIPMWEFTVTFQSQLPDLTVLEEGIGTEIPEVGRVIFGDNDFRLMFSAYYEGFLGRFEDTDLTSVGNSSQFGAIHRLSTHPDSSLLDTQYVSGLTMTGQCVNFGESVNAPCGPNGLVVNTPEDEKWVWMSCSADPENAYCDEIVLNLEIAFQEL